MTEALIPNFAALPALVRGGAAAATRAEAAESFAAQFERSQAAATDVATDPLPVPDHDVALDDAAPHDASPDALSEFLTHWPGCAAPCAAPAAVIATQATASAAPPADKAAAVLTVSAPASPTSVAPSTLPRGAEASIVARDSGAASTLAASRSATPGMDRTVRSAGTERAATRERVDLGSVRRGPAPTGDELSTTAAPIAGVASDAESAAGREATPADPEPGATAVAPDTGFAILPAARTPAATATAPLAAQAAALETAPSNQQTSPIAQLASSRPAAFGGMAHANNERHHAPLPTLAVAESTRDAGTADSRATPPVDEAVPASRPHGARTDAMLAAAAGSPLDRQESPAPVAGNGPATTEPPSTARPTLIDMATVPSPNLSTSTPVPASGNAPPPSSSGMAAPVLADMSTPVPSPQFAHALGVQVSVLARAGIERAELQLNPASMGPLAVQITLDAGHAQVHFGSDSAQTRQIVEAGFPALAAALRDAGFTLSGGGVSQHPGDPRHQGAAARGATNFGLRLDTAPDDEVRPLRTTRASLGRLDLYA